MTPRFSQTNADKIVKSVMYAHQDMLPVYQAGTRDPFVSYFCYFNNQIFTIAYLNSLGLLNVARNHENNACADT